MIHLPGVLAAAKGVPAAATGLAAIVIAQGSCVIDAVPGGSSATEILNGGAIVAAFALLGWILRQTLGKDSEWVRRDHARSIAREAAEEVVREWKADR